MVVVDGSARLASPGPTGGGGLRSRHGLAVRGDPGRKPQGLELVTERERIKQLFKLFTI